MKDQEELSLPREDLEREISPHFAAIGLRDVDGAPPILAGHFSPFDQWTEIDSLYEGRFMERFRPGAFLESFERRTPKITFNHGHDPDLGDKLLGHPVTVGEDELGGTYEAPLFPGVPPLLVDGLRAGAYGASFRFSVDEEDVVRSPKRSDYNPEGLPERSVLKASVSELGPVTFPAYAGATASIRSVTDRFRPAAETVAEMAKNHPAELARMIEDVIKPTVVKPEPAPTPAPAVRRFRTREEYLAWLSKI